jgi:hypothetical protein
MEGNPVGPITITGVVNPETRESAGTGCKHAVPVMGFVENIVAGNSGSGTILVKYIDCFS